MAGLRAGIFLESVRPTTRTAPFAALLRSRTQPSDRGGFRAALFVARAVMAVTAPREALCLVFRLTRLGGQEFQRCLITNGHMSCGSRFPPKRKRSFPILAVMPTLKLAGALVGKQRFPSEGLERCRGDGRSQVGQALICTRRLIRLNRRTLIRGHGAA
jgi:hypothetical protein